MEELIPIASKLQDVLGALGQNTTLDLPQIVVVGGQSSGKSSVLEAIVGRSFLPRGHGIVTRRPLVLQLYNTASPSDHDDTNRSGYDEDEDSTPAGGVKLESNSAAPLEQSTEDDTPTNESNNNNLVDPQSQEWGEFLHLPGRRFHDFTAIRTEIVRDTDRLTGKNKGINPTPIHLKIYSPHVLALTMVDLPGMAKVAVGDQPVDIEEQIREMSLKYVSNPNAIILAVTGANTDLANSDAIKLSQELDPFGERTLGVLTKLDLMDPGTDVSNVLRNTVIPLRKGYIGVVNRGQLDVESDLSIRDGLKNERHFVRNHPVYGRDASLMGMLGTDNLARKLNAILMHHIRECLPELKSRIITMMNDVQMELDMLGDTTIDGSSSSNLGGALLSLLSKFSSNFANTIEGRVNHTQLSTTTNTNSTANTNHHHITNNLNTTSPGTASQQQQQHKPSTASPHNELCGGARISYIFNDIFTASLMSVGAFDSLTDEEIRTTIRNANGTRRSLFVPEISFDILVRRQITRLEQPGLQCVDLVYEELQRIASQCEPSELTRFPNLRDRLVEVVSGLLKRAVGPSQMMVTHLVKIELAYINTSHPDFISASQVMARLTRKAEKEKEDAANRMKQEQLMLQQQIQHQQQQHQQQQHQEEHDALGDNAVGATPLSSSSLNHYLNDPKQPDSPYILNGRPDESNKAGIINYIFGGGAKTPNNNNNNNHNNNNNKTPNKSILRPIPGNAPSPYIGSNGGPPTIVQLPQIPDTMRQTGVPPTDREKNETEIIKSLIESYFSLVRKNYIDMVPKTIMYFLVNHVRDAMQNELVAELYRDAEVHILMKEAEDVAQRRKTCIEMKDLLTTALDIVNEVRDFNTFK